MTVRRYCQQGGDDGGCGGSIKAMSATCHECGIRLLTDDGHVDGS